MTREEIIKELEKTVAGAEILTSLGYEEVNEYLDIFKVALSALRPITREQAEKVWRGEWIQEDPPVEFYICSKCGESAVATADHGYHYRSTFCPHCGAPMTDKALEITMKRLEELRND